MRDSIVDPQPAAPAATGKALVHDLMNEELDEAFQSLWKANATARRCT